MKTLVANVRLKVNKQAKEVIAYVYFSKKNLENEVKYFIFEKIEQQVAEEYPEFNLTIEIIESKEDYEKLKAEAERFNNENNEKDEVLDKLKAEALKIALKRIEDFLNISAEGALIKDIITNLAGKDYKEVIKEFLQKGALTSYVKTVVLCDMFDDLKDELNKNEQNKNKED